VLSHNDRAKRNWKFEINTEDFLCIHMGRLRNMEKIEDRIHSKPTDNCKNNYYNVFKIKNVHKTTTDYIRSYVT
jgi:hypothetical protein